MSAPTARVRADMYERDLNQCAACGQRDGLSHQHRRATGMGGSSERPSITDSLTLCVSCNGRAERDLQVYALVYGWKVRKWVRDPSLVPVFYPYSVGWARLTGGGAALPLHVGEATEMMRAVYGPQWDQWRAVIGVQMPERSRRNG